jgi:predicted MPP superfamily phosphohydrolase
MKPRIVIFLTVFLLLFGSLNYYVGLRLWQWVGLVRPVSGWWFVLGVGLISSSFLIARLGGKYLPRRVANLFTVVGGYWFLVIFYAPPLLLVVEIGRLLNQWLGFIPAARSTDAGLILGTLLLLLIGGVLLYGRWRARNPVVVHYEVEVPKPGGNHEELRIALVSDTHLGAINGRRQLRQLVEMVNALNPDLVIHAGDLIDDEVANFVQERMADELKRLRPRLGSYIVLGNHDYPAGYTPEYRALLASAGVQLLLDEYVKVDDSFYIIGRDDWSGQSRGGRPRKPLAAILQGTDPALPRILIDHQPNRLNEAAEAGVDLLVCGHTHRGQMFPNQYLTRKVFEIDWGHLQKGALHVIVSLGFGTWGPPVRIGNRPEVVSIRVRFIG